MLGKYATDQLIAETESSITRFAQPAGMSPSQYVEELVAKTIHCGDVYEGFALNWIFIKVLGPSIR